MNAIIFRVFNLACSSFSLAKIAPPKFRLRNYSFAVIYYCVKLPVLEFCTDYSHLSDLRLCTETHSVECPPQRLLPSRLASMEVCFHLSFSSLRYSLFKVQLSNPVRVVEHCSIPSNFVRFPQTHCLRFAPLFRAAFLLYHVNSALSRGFY